MLRRSPWMDLQRRRLETLLRWTASGELRQHLIDRRMRKAGMRMRPLTGPKLREALGLGPEAPPPAAASLRLPSAVEPVVSIVIPTYGQVDYTLRCLASIAAHPPSMPFEVLVVDDASGDPRVAELEAVQGIRLTRRVENLGFLRSCNAAAAEAKGEFIFLLNNDTEVAPGAVEALVALLRARPGAGMVGAQLLYPDGPLQEAGGIIWQDGSGWNYGQRDDMRKPEYNYVREVDYISGAAIMIARSLWQRMGGFDELYLPAYCEDSDLAFRIRAAGLKVLYQPDAKVIHYEGISHGTDTATGIKAYQVANSEKLRLRWQSVLEQDHLPNGERVMRARDHALHRKVVLVIDHRIPEPDRDAGSRTMMALLDALLAAGHVVKFWPEDRRPSPGYQEQLQRRGIEVPVEPWASTFANWITVNGREIDAVLLSRPTVAEDCLVPLRAHCKAPIVFYGHDLHHARMRQEAEATEDAATSAEATKMEALERRVWSEVDVVLYPSSEEAARVREMAPGTRAFAISPYVLPDLVPRVAVPPASAGLIFVAGFGHSPNVDAAVWLVGEILPLIRARYPELPLVLAGSNPTEAVLALAGDGVEVTGFVPDEELARRYAAARVAICPLRFGAGVKMKVVEALHQGLPLVTTPVGVQGLDGLEAIVDVAETPEEMAAAVVRLLEDQDLCATRGAAGQAYVHRRFSPEALRESMEAAFAAAGNKDQQAS